MKSILNSCEPRPDIIAGTFNPEIFTASLSEVDKFYSGQSPGINAIYTDAEQFFREGTYATDGMRMKTMLAGQPRDPNVAIMLEELRRKY
jgi:hypothetical protein